MIERVFQKRIEEPVIPACVPGPGRFSHLPDQR
jgi:hypothetical protein